MSVEPNDGKDAATQAFDALREEVAQLRTDLAAIGDGSPDYAPTLGAIAATLGIIEAHPALRLAPGSFANEMRLAIENAHNQARQEILKTTYRIENAAFGLEKIVGRARSTADQRRRERIITSVGVLVGVVGWVGLSGPIARALPDRWSVPERMAAATLWTGRWDGGARMMKSADPAGYQALLHASEFVGMNQKPLAACAEVAAKTGRPRRCVVEVGVLPDR